MSKRDGQQKGPQQHPQGGHGERTHQAIADQLKSRRDKTDDQPSPVDAAGKHHIYEDRQQHDEADKNSEKERLRRDREKGRAGEK